MKDINIKNSNVKKVNLVFFWIFIIWALTVLILNALRIFLDIDVIRDNPQIIRYLYVAQDMPIAIKILYAVLYAAVIVFLYRKFSFVIDSAKNK